MASADFTRGQMDIREQQRTWSGFLRGSLWGSLILMLVLAYLTFTLAIGLNWFISLVIVAGLGLVAGVALGMGGAWIATVVALSALAVFVQAVIALASAVIPG